MEGMNRVSLKCANCGNQNLFVNVNHFVPRGISLECHQTGCGRITPLAFFDKDGWAYAVNGEATLQAFGDTYCGDVTRREAEAALEVDRCEAGG